ncbi:MAG: penicillin-binding protein 2 [Armatimonadota bacterium]
MDQQDYNKRLKYFKIILFAALIVLFARLVYLQVIKGSYYSQRAKDNMILQMPIKAPRGIIYDREGRVLVKNKPSFDVYIIPDQMVNYSATIKELSKFLKVKEKEIYRLIKENNYDKSRAIKIKDNITKLQLFKLEESKDKYPGIYIHVEPIREYVNKDAGSHILGFVGEVDEEELAKLKAYGYKPGDLIGKQGLEKQYEECLRGKDGAKLMLVDSSGRIVKSLGQRPPVPGNNLYLNIDADIQNCAYKSVKKTINSLKASGVYDVGASAVCIDARTGKVLAMVSWPDYDPNLFIKGMSHKQYKELILENFHPLLNRNVSTSFPCASTFKIVTSTAALENNLVEKDTVLYCPGYYNVGNIRFNCFQKAGHGSINFLEAIAYSCDVVFYRLGEKLGVDKILKYADAYGLGSLTGIDLSEEIKGLLPDEKWKEKTLGEKWYPGDTVNLSIGQGFLQVTPIQVSQMTQKLANRGKSFKPFIAQKITDPEDKTIKEFLISENTGTSDIKNETFEIIKEGMSMVTEKGTAAGLNIKEFKIAGKTGTVENLSTQINPYGRNHTWFTCFAPYDKNTPPEIVVTVFFEQSGRFGGDIAAPVAYDIAKCYYEKYHKKEEEK